MDETNKFIQKSKPENLDLDIISHNDKRDKLREVKQNQIKAEKILSNTNRKICQIAVSNLSKELEFDVNVVKEWSPYSTGYEKPDFKLYTKLDNIVKKPQQKAKSNQKKIHHFKPHMPCHLTSLKDNARCTFDNETKDCKKSDSFLLGVSDSEERLKQIPLQELHHIEKPRSKKDEFKSHPKLSKCKWDEYVLSLVSKNTAEMIVKNYTTHNQQILKRFIDKQKKKEESKGTSNIKELSNEISQSTVSQNTEESVENLGGKGECFDSQSNTNLLECLDRVKPSPKKFQNVLQDSYPLSPSQWTKIQHSNSRTKNLYLKRGMRKWADYPKEVKSEELILQKASSFNILGSKTDNIDLKTTMEQRGDCNLLLAVDEWRSKWLLEKKWQNKSFEEIRVAMKSINDHVRLAAVSGLAKVILTKRSEKGVDEDVIAKEEEEMIEEIRELYDDNSPHVQIAAAVSMFSIDRADERAKALLLDTVKSGQKSERWLAAQCLAEFDNFDDCIIIELLSHFNQACDPLKRKKVEKMLGKLSVLTDSIQFMLSEQLNSTTWIDRFTACQLLPVLNGPMKKDIANKISFLMWHDWSKEVRMAAAVALGKMGYGKLVHDSLCKYLKSSETPQQIEALKKVSKLGIVTAQLMLPFLECLKSNKDTVCMESIRVCRKIALCSEQVIDSLISLASSARSVRIKRSAIKTLSIVGSGKTAVRDCLLWAMHYEKQPTLRAKACESIGRIGFNDKEIITTMQDMLVVEEDDDVKRKIITTLHHLGFSETCDEGMVTAVQKRVKQLCAKENMLLHVLADSEKELEMYLKQQQEKPESCNQVKHTSNNYNSDHEIDDIITGNFDATLEAYRARNEKTVPVELPIIQSSYIPYWTESKGSISFERE